MSIPADEPLGQAKGAGHSHVTDAMRAGVGGVVDRRVSYPVTDSDIRRWALAVYWPEPPPPHYLGGPEGTVVAPEEFNPFAWRSAEVMEPGLPLLLRDTDKPEKMMGIAGPGLTNQIAGGLDVTYAVPIQPGDVITSQTRLTEYRERQGRLGLMLITTFETTWTNQHGDLVKTERTTSIRY